MYLLLWLSVISHWEFTEAFVENDTVETYRQAMDHVFGGGSCHVLKIRKYGGMQVL